MTKRQQDIIKLKEMYQHLYKVKHCHIWSVECLLKEHLELIYKDNLEKKYISIIEPFHNYVMKQIMLGETREFDISISNDLGSKNPYLTIHRIYSDFTIPKNWTHIGLVTQIMGLDEHKLYINSAKNISLDTTTDTQYDDVYKLIYHILHKNIIVTKAVYLKIIRKILGLWLEPDCHNKSMKFKGVLQIKDLDDFLTNYMIMYIPKHRHNFKLLEHQAKVLHQTWDEEDRLSFMRNILESS